MEKTMMLALAVTLALGTLRGGETLSVKGGTCAAADGGAFTLEFGGKRIDLAAYWVDPRWGKRAIPGALKAKVEGESLHFDLDATRTPAQDLHSQHPMMVCLRGDASVYLQERLRLGNIEKTFEKGAWGWGDKLAFVPFQMEMKLSSPLSMNYVAETKGTWELRLYFQSKPDAEGRARYAGTLDFVSKPVRIEPPVDIVAQKRLQYSRVLAPPQEKGFDPARWRALAASTNSTRQDFSRLEDLFDARSRLYATAERLAMKPTPDAEAARLVAAGYAALNALNLEAATNACVALESRLAGSEKWMPYGIFNPFNWVKCFTQWGYQRAADGCSVSEPNPWLMEWNDGFRCSLAQDARVAIALPKGECRGYETRYLRAMEGVSFERTWTSTSWNLPDRRITFSLLTPIVDVEGVDVLTLSGLPSAPRTMYCPNDRGQFNYVRLVSSAETPAEVIPSVLMDFTAPPPAPKSWSCGEQKIPVDHMIGPYFIVGGADWRLAFFPTARPLTAEWRKGTLTIRFEGKGDVGMLRLMDNLQHAEQASVCEFFARVHLAQPVVCRSTVENGVARWQYEHRRRRNAWGTVPLAIAPVPPLVDYANLEVPGSRPFKYPTKWGLFRYCEGAEVTCPLPRDLPREPRLRGVNVGVNDSDELWEAHATNGAHWVRACFGGKAALDGQCAALEDKLRKYGTRMKFLVDPHCREYRVDWKGGADPDPNELGKFFTLWDRLSKLGAKYPHAIEGYDLYNEPGLTAGGEARWRAINEKVADAIHRNHPGAKIYYSAVYGGNPNGLFNLSPLAAACGPQVTTYHFYSPHAFTHQKCATHNRGGDTCVFYPAWAAPIDWSAGHHFGGTTVDWFDRWTLAAILLPAYEHYAEHRTPLHVGEFSVIGYANGKSPYSCLEWTRDTVELIEANGASWHLWNGGFGLGNPHVRKYIHGLWRQPVRQ